MAGVCWGSAARVLRRSAEDLTRRWRWLTRLVCLCGQAPARPFAVHNWRVIRQPSLLWNLKRPRCSPSARVVVVQVVAGAYFVPAPLALPFTFDRPDFCFAQYAFMR